MQIQFFRNSYRPIKWWERASELRGSIGNAQKFLAFSHFGAQKNRKLKRTSQQTEHFKFQQAIFIGMVKHFPK